MRRRTMTMRRRRTMTMMTTVRLQETLVHGRFPMISSFEILRPRCLYASDMPLESVAPDCLTNLPTDDDDDDEEEEEEEVDKRPQHTTHRKLASKSNSAR
jgi:hypothetical protein